MKKKTKKKTRGQGLNINTVRIQWCHTPHCACPVRHVIFSKTEKKNPDTCGQGLNMKIFKTEK